MSDLHFVEDDIYRSFTLENDVSHFEEPILYRGVATLLEPPPASFWSPFESPDQLAPLGSKSVGYKAEPGVLAGLELIGEPSAGQYVVEEEWELDDTIEGPFSSELSLEPAVWVDLINSFGCGARAPHTVLNRVCAHLGATHVPFSVNAKQASVEGRLEVGAACCGFVLAAFRGATGDAVFELQRRHGCGLLFADLFKRILAWLGPAVKQQLALPWESSTTALPPLDLGEFPPPLTLGAPQPPLDLTPEDTTALLTMLEGGQKEVQLDSLRVLTTAAKESTPSATVVCEGLALRVREWELASLPQQDDNQKGYDLDYELARWKKVLISTVQEQDLNPGAKD